MALLLILLTTAVWFGVAYISHAAYIKNRRAEGFDIFFCPKCGSRLERRELAGQQRIACSDCDFVHWNNPKPVTATLIAMDGGIVMVKRKFAPHPGSWCLPCGFIEAQENPPESAAREVVEESGLIVEIERIVTAIRPKNGINEIVLFYIAKPVGGALKAGDDAVDARIFRKEDLPADIPFTTHKKLIDLWFAGQLNAGGSVDLS